MTARTLALAFALLAALPARAADAAAGPPAPGVLPELHVVIVEQLGESPSSFSSYDRMVRVLTDVFERRKWPVTLKFERFGANTPKHEIELRIFFQGIREETFGDLTYRAWVTLNEHGRKHDFGIVKFRYYARPGQPMDDRLDYAVRGAGFVVAGRVEAILFPLQLPPPS